MKTNNTCRGEGDNTTADGTRRTRPRLTHFRLDSLDYRLARLTRLTRLDSLDSLDSLD